MSDIPYNVWAANEIEKLRAENAVLREDSDADALLWEARDALDRVANLIHYQYTGTKEGMTMLQIASDLADSLVKRIDAARKS